MLSYEELRDRVEDLITSDVYHWDSSWQEVYACVDPVTDTVYLDYIGQSEYKISDHPCVIVAWPNPNGRCPCDLCSDYYDLNKINADLRSAEDADDVRRIFRQSRYLTPVSDDIGECIDQVEAKIENFDIDADYESYQSLVDRVTDDLWYEYEQYKIREAAWDDSDDE